MLLLLVLYSVVVNCASDKECIQGQHSKAYLSCKDDGRPLYTLFIRETFLDMDPCYPVDNTGYRKILTKMNIEQPSGYDVEHIIDTSNSIEGYLYIVGNLILSNSSWNRGVGSFCWDNVRNEKSEVYGDIFDKAYTNAIECKKRGEDQRSVVVSIDRTIVLVLLAIFCVLFVGCLVYIFKDVVYSGEKEEIEMTEQSVDNTYSHIL